VDRECAGTADHEGHGDVVRSSFRGASQARTLMYYCTSENLEIPGLVLAHPE
jgi:hypothetical protein